MQEIVQAFLSDDSGAITVDFVVLTSAIVFLGLIVVTTFSGGATALANGIANQMGNMSASPES
ncbi:MAG: hypothetical protein ACSHW1_02650 [Yoonia sp.]|uniref:hypothetical protein n=1 Tax=Yoonia sp. TaxID=2212373 RepID=UPI003EF87176